MTVDLCDRRHGRIAILFPHPVIQSLHSEILSLNIKQCFGNNIYVADVEKAGVVQAFGHGVSVQYIEIVRKVVVLDVRQEVVKVDDLVVGAIPSLTQRVGDEF